ncbi:MAG: ABC transporter substrate-binding protein [Clostridia bacterium]|nr:ABC transporter substrate-binding protein [Clostridia bacterium]
MKRKVLAVTMLISIVVLITAGCGERNLTKVRLSEVTHSVFYAPQYAALTLGYFEDEGLDVVLTNGQGADKVMTAVLSGQADIGFAGPEASIYVYNEGKEDHAVTFAQLTKRDGSFLIGRQPEPGFKWSNLKGKTIIGGRKGGVPEMTLEYVLKKNGLVPGKDVEINTSVQFALMAGAFTGGQGDYVTLFEPTASLLETQGKGHILASIGKESGEIPYTAYFAKKSYIENSKDVIQKFTNAIYKGQIWVDIHTPEEIADTIKSNFPDTDISLLITVIERYKLQDAWSKDPVMKKESLDLLQKVMQEAGQLKKTAPYEKIVSTDYAKAAMDRIRR